MGESRIEIIEAILHEEFDVGMVRANLIANEILDRLDAFAEKIENERLATQSDGTRECWFIAGLGCNQRTNLCDKGKFEPNCIMLAVKMIMQNIRAEHRFISKEAIEDAVLYLFDKEYIKEEFWGLSPASVVDRIMKELDEKEKQQEAVLNEKRTR